MQMVCPTVLRFLTFQRIEVSFTRNPFDSEVKEIMLKFLWVEILKTSSMHSIKDGVSYNI